MKCLDEMTLHVYLDGELSSEMQNKAEAHIVSCAACAILLSVVEAERAAVAQAFACGELIDIPTARLRANINIAIGSQSSPARSSKGFWRIPSLLDLFSLPGNLRAPNLKPAFASLIVVFVLVAGAAIWMKRSVPTTDVAYKSSMRQSQLPGDSNSQAENKVNHRATQAENLTTIRDAADTGIEREQPVSRGESNVAVRFEPSKVKIRTYDARGAARSRLARPRRRDLLPGEETYLDAIASLKTSVEVNGETTLPKSVRDAYKRNLEVVDEAIIATRLTATTDPTDLVAANFLREAYESKLQLLSSLATQIDGNRK